jgi:hypothetical protein
MWLRKSKLPTNPVDNSVDYGVTASLSVGFYYGFVKLIKLKADNFSIIKQ